jgi:hypothetical protein
MVRSESLVALPCGPTVSAKSGNPSRFKSYFPIPLYVSRFPARKRFLRPHVQVIQSNRQSAFDRNKVDHIHHRINFRQAFPPTTRRSNASAERGSALDLSQRFVAARVAPLAASRHAAEKGNF